MRPVRLDARENSEEAAVRLPNGETWRAIATLRHLDVVLRIHTDTRNGVIELPIWMFRWGKL